MYVFFWGGGDSRSVKLYWQNYFTKYHIYIFVCVAFYIQKVTVYKKPQENSLLFHLSVRRETEEGTEVAVERKTGGKYM